jgi:hypothetical protein
MSGLSSMRTMVLVDVTNLYYAASRKWHGKKIDYEKITKKVLGDNTNVEVMLAYGGFRRHYMNFVKIMQNMGYDFRFKEINEYCPHVSWTAKMTLDSTGRGDIEKYIFMSNDYGLVDLYEHLKSHKRYVEVWAPSLPLAIQRAADEVFEFGDNYCADTPTKAAKSGDAERSELG